MSTDSQKQKLLYKLVFSTHQAEEASKNRGKEVPV